MQYWGEIPDSHFSGFASFGVSTQDGLTELGQHARETETVKQAGAEDQPADVSMQEERADPV